MSEPNFVYVTYIATTPEKLWQALTDGAFTERYWFGTRVESDWSPGARVTFSRNDTRSAIPAKYWNARRIGGSPTAGTWNSTRNFVGNVIPV
jgi:uncharacterized protein YndB with AHSA1/START domain